MIHSSLFNALYDTWYQVSHIDLDLASLGMVYSPLSSLVSLFFFLLTIISFVGEPSWVYLLSLLS